MRYQVPVICLLVVMMAITPAAAQRFDEQFSHWPVQLKINGRILIDNGLQDWGEAKSVIDSVARNNSVVCFYRGADSSMNELARALKDSVAEEGYFQFTPFVSLPVGELKEVLSWASVVVIQSGPSDATDLVSLLTLKTQFDEFLARGMTLIVDAAVAQMLGQIALPERASPGINLGLNLFPDSVLRCDDEDQEASQARLLRAVTAHPGTVGIGLPRKMMLLLSGRKVTCYGPAQATFVLAGCDHAPPRIEKLAAMRFRQQASPDSLLDLMEWRRDAIDRTLAPFPPATPETPFVEDGTLVIVGGGGMPAGLMNRFVDLAGGIDRARLVYVPCSEDDDASYDQGPLGSWKRMGVKHVAFFHTKDRRRANSEGDLGEEFLAPLKNATGIWFGGGRQWNLADSYYGTRAHRLMKEVLHRGGVIGGSSAGASIQARYLARATPIGNFRIMAPGYERGGLGFISGVAIDQHFTQRGRQKDMTELMNRHPQLLGIGLDEATAIIVQKSKADVVGKGRVFFYDRRQPLVADEPDHVALPTGSSYDLATREVLFDATLPADATAPENASQPVRGT